MAVVQVVLAIHGIEVPGGDPLRRLQVVHGHQLPLLFSIALTVRLIKFSLGLVLHPPAPSRNCYCCLAVQG